MQEQRRVEFEVGLQWPAGLILPWQTQRARFYCLRELVDLPVARAFEEIFCGRAQDVRRASLVL